MKKIVLKILLALVPLYLYLAVFISFEPNNYFGVQNNSSTNSPIARIRAYQAQPENTIILGDSRMAHFDMQLVSETANTSVSNAAYGGAGIHESIDEFYVLYDINPNIENVIFGVSFYTLNEAYSPVNRMETVQTQLKNPIAYIFNLEYNVNTLTVIQDRISYALRGEQYDDVLATATYTQQDYNDTEGELEFRKDLVDYAVTLYTNCANGGTSAITQRIYSTDGQLENAREITDYIQNSITPENSKFTLNTKALDQLAQLAEFCENNSINLTFVLPPMEESVRKLVCEPLGIDEDMQEAITALENTPAQVLNYEWEQLYTFNDTQFYDGFHLDVVYGLPDWTKDLFEKVAIK